MRQLVLGFAIAGVACTVFLVRERARAGEEERVTPKVRVFHARVEAKEAEPEPDMDVDFALSPARDAIRVAPGNAGRMQVETVSDEPAGNGTSIKCISHGAPEGVTVQYVPKDIQLGRPFKVIA